MLKGEHQGEAIVKGFIISFKLEIKISYPFQQSKRNSFSCEIPLRPPTDEIIPVYRRDCHQQVHAGSHQYPGSGVYLLKFDNSYSLWRSKTLYYRVYYTR